MTDIPFSKLRRWLIKPSSLWSQILSASLLIAVFVGTQCLSIYHYQGEKVDESELAYFGVAILQGELDPHWYGYGIVGMYLLGAVYGLLIPIEYLLGNFFSLTDYAARLFSSGFFIITGRAVFAAVGALTVYCYLCIGERLSIPRGILALFLFCSLFSIDGIYFANYIRCDQLVALWTALTLLCLISSLGEKLKLSLICLICALAINSKISSIGILSVIPVYIYFERPTWSSRIISGIRMIAAALILTEALNPFSSLSSHLLQVTNDSVHASRVSFMKDGHFGFWPHTFEILSVLNRFVGIEILQALVLSPFLLFSLIGRKIFVYSVVLTLAYVAPYYFGTEITYYWFVPIFSLLRFLSVAGIGACIILIQRKHTSLGKIMYATAFLGIALTLLPPGIANYVSVREEMLFKQSNVFLAKDWLETHALGEKSIFLDTHYDHVMPKIYGEDFEEAADISRAFLYGRDSSGLLSQAFRHFLHDSYLPRFEGRSHVAKIGAFNPKTESAKVYLGKGLFVATPFVYNRFLHHTGEGLDEYQRKVRETVNNYYSLMLKHDLLIRFDKGTGPPIEIYEFSY